MTFKMDDSSVEDSRPVEVFTFTSQRLVDPVIARSTSYHRDVSFGGDVYTARPIRRGGAEISNVNGQQSQSMTVEVEMSDPVAQFYLGNGVPPQNLEVHIRRIQLTSGGDERVALGHISECSVSGRTAVFSIDPPLSVDLATPCPSWQVSRRCQRTLYDTGCGEQRALNEVPTTISTLFDGTSMHVASMTNGFGTIPESHFLFGELLHKPSGERRTIVAANPTRFIRLDVTLPLTAQVGDDITITKGCTKSVEWCRDKFNNVVNFGGNPHIRSTRFFWDHPSLMKVRSGRQ